MLTGKKNEFLMTLKCFIAASSNMWPSLERAHKEQICSDVQNRMNSK